MDPTQIGKYRDLSFIGQGAMGRVYKAHDPILNRNVAIKTISSALATDPELRRRFHREAQAAARLNHPNIITVYDYGEEGDTIYISMELLEGTDLKEFLSSGALKSLGAKLRIMEQICEGLDFAHSKGVIHRDLKPANIHVTMNGQVKIMDFGLARLDSGNQSKAGVVVGTPNYMSPEQVMGDEVDVRTDVFSAGAVFYELLSNKKPFDADSVHGILFQVVHKQPTPVREISRELPPIVAEVVEKALAKDRADRFQTAAELREALSYIEHALASGRPQEARLSRGKDKTLHPSLTPLPPRPAGLPVRADAVDGTVALDIKPEPRPALRPAPASGARNRSKPPSRPSAPRVAPPPAPAPSHSKAAIAVLVAVLALGGAAVYHFRNGLALPIAAPTTSGPSASEQALRHVLARTKMELAAAKLQDKDYKAALGAAEEAQRLEPADADIARVRTQAQGLVDQVEESAKEARDAAKEGDAEHAGAALSKLLALDPKHPAAADVSALLNGSFRRQAEEAHRLADAARKDAEHGGGAKSESFRDATGLLRDADAQFKRGSFADAARAYLESRDEFDHARRAASTPAPKSAVAAAPETAAPAAAPATSAPATAPPTMAAALSPPPAVVARRSFVVGGSTVQSKPAGNGLAGFEGASVQKATEFQGRVDLEPYPMEVRPGDSYLIKASFTNLGRKAVRLREATLNFTVNGRPRSEPVPGPLGELPPQQTVSLGQTAGTWEEGIESWSLQVVITSDKGDLCKREVKLR